MARLSKAQQRKRLKNYKDNMQTSTDRYIEHQEAQHTATLRRIEKLLILADSMSLADKPLIEAALNDIQEELLHE